MFQYLVSPCVLIGMVLSLASSVAANPFTDFVDVASSVFEVVVDAVDDAASDVAEGVEEFGDDLGQAAEIACDLALSPHITVACEFLPVAEGAVTELIEPSPCGRAGQRPCDLPTDFKRKIELGGFECEPGLIPVPFTLCFAPVSLEEALAKTEEVAQLTAAIIAAYTEFQTQSPLLWAALAVAIADQDVQRVEQIIRDSTYFDEVLALMNAMGFQTLTLAGESEGSLLLGFGTEVGVAIDTAFAAPPQVYRTKAISIGGQFGLGGDVAISAYLPANRCLGGAATGRGFEIDKGPGAGAAIWYVDGAFAGTTVDVGVFGVGAGVAQSYAETEMLTVSESEVDRFCSDAPIPDMAPATATAIYRPIQAQSPEAAPVERIDPEPVTEPQIVTVASGDTLWALADIHLGDPWKYVALYEVNQPLLNSPDLILPGQELTLPASDG